MASANLEITVNIVLWFFCEDFGYFSIDEPIDELEGIIHQLYAENKRWG